MDAVGTDGLREARVRRGLSLAQAAARTGVPLRHLQAAEWGRFDLIPPRLVRRVVARYCDVLRVDPTPYLETLGHQPRPLSAAVRSAAVLVVTAAAVAVLVSAGPGTGTNSQRGERPLAERPPDRRSPDARAASVPRLPLAGGHEFAGGTPAAELEVVAARGDCWIAVLRGAGSDAEVLFQGTLRKGEARSFTGRRLGITLGAAAHVDLFVDGRRAPAYEGTLQLAVSAAGLRPAG